MFSRVSPRARRWLYALLLLVLVAALVSFTRWAVLSHSLYELNLRVKVLLRQMPVPAPKEKVLIFAPHEDDETLGCAGYIQQAIGAGADVKIVMMTNGEYPETAVLLFEDTLRRGPEQFIQLGYMRQRETLAAMKYLGLPTRNIAFLGYPNQYLNQMWLPKHWLPSDPVRSTRTRSTRSPYANSMTPNAIYCGQSALQDVETILMREKPDVVITLHPADIHMDHWPTYTFVRFALEELSLRGESFARDCHLYTYLIHRPYWPAPRGYHPKADLQPPASLAATRQTNWLYLSLTPDQTDRKHKATGLYRTQGGSIDPLMQAFSRSNELFGALPDLMWPSEEDVPMTPVAIDPIEDLYLGVRNPSADIITIQLARKSGRMTVEINTHGNASKRIEYHACIHAVETSSTKRIIAQYDWRGTKAAGTILKDDELEPVFPGSLAVHFAGTASILEAPWPMSDRAPGFFMIRTWTTRGGSMIDGTATATFKIPQR